MKDSRPTLAVDFDGVICDSYPGGEWTYTGEPMEGAREALLDLHKTYRLVVFTARHDLMAVRDWLHKHRLEHLFHDVTNRKPVAVTYIDDRAVRFQTWPQVMEVLK